MSYRKDKAKAAQWQDWVKRHQESLIEIGIPREVWSEPMDWWRFVDHGYHPPVSNSRDVRVSADDLSDDRQRRLFEFLRDTLSEGNRVGSTLWAVLRARFGSGEPPDNSADS
jgi:hypothetical protein